MTTSSKAKKRYVLVGTGGRSFMFSESLLGTYADKAELLAMCDSNKKRLAYNVSKLAQKYDVSHIRQYAAADFDKMIKEQKPDVVIVTTMDRTHHEYIIRAMELGCDVITEKPMTTDEVKCQAIVDTVERTGRKLRVTFNYRYSPSRSKVRELIMQGAIGDVLSVHFEWLLDTNHGADYFRRWHRNKANSGGLMVHKSTHHFDLVNWWLGSEPKVVFGLGKLAFYGKVNGEKRGLYHPYTRSTGSEAAKGDPFALDLTQDENHKGLYYDAESEDAYIRDQNVFGDGINIEDTMNLVVGYKSGAQLSYSLTAYAPWEGYRVAFNGSKGRIELEVMEKSYISAGNSHISDGTSHSERLLLLPQFSKPEVIEVEQSVGGHGGGDLKLLADLFDPETQSDPLGRAAGHRDGAMSILTGIAANKSFATGLPVKVSDLVRI